jgi:hypothetical protein
MIFMHCILVSARWQWSINLYKNRKKQLYTTRKTVYKTIQTPRIYKIENKQTKKETNKKNIENNWSN